MDGHEALISIAGLVATFMLPWPGAADSAPIFAQSAAELHVLNAHRQQGAGPLIALDRAWTVLAAHRQAAAH